MRTFGDVVAVLQQHHFFDVRLNPAKGLYIDGPEDQVTVVRCGLTTMLGTIPRGGEVELGDDQSKAFFKLEDGLRSAIFSENWIVPSPAP